MFDTKGFRSGTVESDEALDPRSRLRTLRRHASYDDPAERAGSNYSVQPPDPGSGSSWRRLAERWLPESLLRSRVDPGRVGVLALALVAFVVLVGVGIGAWAGQPTAEPAPPPISPPPISPLAPATTRAPPELVVSVVGRVARPGLVTVSPGDRVADAVESAGGPLPDTDLTGLNLARRLVDGEQLYVAVSPPPQASPGQPGGDGKVDLNTATVEQLDELPGVGKVTAKRIVQWRDEHGRFDSVEQLREIDGIGESRFARLREVVRV
ncbi:ComEA family DNA-binding protein [Saccharopolyspora phatthalungensis]|uniref:Competence protein ComEA n=1 Tax=Saccharopolyspora phatthalungensis TaxID=664693 RepID=A0A840Q3R3_9PSEU|nr:ComEA family DNA-binding protein [Saccharopolyspora phatthalungensis]MBB5153015.1 competence protein ComEA [Saccharopolyspora phatthalungensis]